MTESYHQIVSPCLEEEASFIPSAINHYQPTYVVFLVHKQFGNMCREHPGNVKEKKNKNKLSFSATPQTPHGDKN